MAFLKRKKQPPSGSPQPPLADERAPELFKRVLANRWAPALRDLGFKGSGRLFVLPDDRDWVMLGFQSSSASNAEWVKFTINLLVVGKQAWEEARERSPYLSAKPSPNTLGPHRYEQRIGFLTHGSDHWWRLYASQDTEPLVAEILVVLRDVAVPRLRQEMTDQSPGPRGTFEGIRQDNR
ncbi:MAG: DUF4304 domain-containing protein [Actinobacteria bacterium]|nr:DUF4304 domain-containing protein [Actinomycetota bacterium]